ncbi:hypothetical protein HYY72_01290 [Candidatus Woesearchaeota archaeon]|nr:hypothetical protein [Candidatus Woesearchaeota archaeon]
MTFYFVNTNRKTSLELERDMLKNKKVAAYSSGWKHKIDRLQKGDKVFLYGSGNGVVAFGIANGILEKAPHGDDSEGEHYMSLENFKDISDKPVSARQIKEITENKNIQFRHTLFEINGASGEKLWNQLMAFAKDGLTLNESRL